MTEDRLVQAVAEELRAVRDPTTLLFEDTDFDGARRTLRRLGEMGALAELSDPDAKALGPFARESETSRQAALSVYPRQGSQRRLILEAFATGKGRMHGFTREELAGWVRLPDNSIRPRVRELIEGGWITQGSKDGKPATRPTRTGRESEVLTLTGRAIARWSGRLMTS